MTQPKKPSDFLGGILRSARTLASRSEVSVVLADILGTDAGARCRIVGETKGKLIVEVDSAPLYAELQGFRRDEIRRALNERLNRLKVSEILFRLHKTAHV